MTAIERRLTQPVDAAGLAAFRIGFGVLMLVAVLRFFAHGWIDEYYHVPRHFFTYWGFEWVKPWPGLGMHLHFAAMALCALGITLGLFYRASVAGFGLLFAYAHLIDKTNYLNHYYLVICLCGLMSLLPLHALGSLDAWRGAVARRRQLPSWMLWTLRAQLGLVYFFGGVAKLKSDWLLQAEPLSIWLSASSDVPVLGAVFAERWSAFAMSWAGALFDLSIVPLLLWRRSRGFAYVAVVVFHALTARLFQLGMFPYIMMLGSLTFLPSSWPRRVGSALAGAVGKGRSWASAAQSGWLQKLSVLRLGSSTALDVGEALPAQGIWAPRPAWVLAVLGTYFAVQLLLPLRHVIYPGSVCWTEQGYRFAWNVMLMEKNGVVDFRVVEPASGRTFRANPRDYFTAYQTKMLASQPDMLLQAAHVVANDFRLRGVQGPRVYADAFVSLNGRPMQRLVDARVDLAREVDGLANKPWILPMNAQLPVSSIAQLGSLE